ncbi:MAG TPA: two-component regulator propeller domain-containing protein [Puia sp.]
MVRLQILTWFFLLGCAACQGQTPAIGAWQDHLPYHQAIALAGAGAKIYCATPYSIFWVDNSDNSIHRMSKTNGLSETGIRAICYDPRQEKLTIAYTNSNVDILSGGRVFNIPDIRRTSLAGDKAINQALVYNGNVYLSTNLGIIVLDEDKYEVKDSYVITADTIPVESLATDGKNFYAATAQGVMKASASSMDLADYHNWTAMQDDGGAYRQLVALNGKVLGLRGDTVYVLGDQGGSFFYTGDGHINGLSVAEERLLVCEQRSDSGRVTILAGSGQVERVLQAAGALESPRQAVLVQGEAWVADSLAGLSAWGVSGNEALAYIPNSPFGLATGPMTIYPDPGGEAGAPGVLWATSGGADTNWVTLHNHDGLFRLDGNGWTNYNSHSYPFLQGISDVDAVGFNARDTSVWAGTFGKGLLEIQPGDRFTVYASGSAVGAAEDDPSAYRVSGIAFDKDGNGWMANYGAAHDLLLRRADGQWFSFAIPFPHPGNAVSQVLVDDYNQVWMVSPKGNGVFCYSPGAVLENVSDDRWKYFIVGAGNGNLPDNHVYCLAKDKSGFIWIGTGNGIGLVQCTQQVFGAGGCEAVWPIVQFDAFAGYLFGGQAVQAIAVDGADRKWVGTRNGVWLISPDAQQIVYHFTADSTPLLSNDVRNIAIDAQTGEVFFATAAGLCSFRSTATEGGEHNSQVLVFPNPVPPGYTGTIAIRGLVDGAIVKVTEASGRLVYQTNALGGQAIWDGKDYRGRKAATGVYLVLVSDVNRHETMATKIVFIGK